MRRFATGDAGVSPAVKEVRSPGRTKNAIRVQTTLRKRLSNKSYTGDAGVSPAGVLEQNEGFCGDF